jgi:hypothetical protein
VNPFMQIFLSKNRVLVVLFVISFQLSGFTADGKTQKFSKSVLAATGSFEKSDVCLNLSARMSSRDFFAGLEKVTAPSGISFVKKSQVFTTYPDSIVLDMLALANRCSAQPRMDAPPKASMMNLLASPNFSAACGAAPMKPLNVSGLQRSMPTPGPTVWEYRLNVKSAGCLLNEPISIIVTSNQGELIWQFDVQL